MSAGVRDIAVIGLALRLPGSESLVELFGHLTAGRSLVTEVPGERWAKDRWFGDPRGGAERTSSVWGGFVADADAFDAAFFAVSPREAATMDPQQRWALELAWGAVEDAGYRASDLAGSRTGVFMGVSHADYAELMEREGAPTDAYLPTGTAFAVVANRVSYHFDLRGPSVVNDTACSSSLVSVHQAVSALRGGECDLALAGGVNLVWSPKLFVAFSQARMLSGTGTSYAFDARADGFVRGEGGAVLLLKPLERALADGDPVHAVIKGAGTNHGGRTNSLTVTNPTAQAELIEQVLTDAGVRPETVGYIEAHGPGTPVGDPIEILGLKRAFRRLHAAGGTEPEPSSCGIGSVKTNIGHLESAAGIAGIVKVIGALTTHTLPATVNFATRNKLIDFDGSPFYVVDETRPWDAPAGADGIPGPRRAGVSSFGFGGTNAHCVLEEFPRGDEAAGDEERDGPQVVPLSARTPERLREVARRLVGHLRAPVTDEPVTAALRPALRLADVAHTLRTGREALPVRVAFAVSGHDELLPLLEEFADQKLAEAAVHRGARTAAEDLTPALEEAGRWVRGDEVTWQECAAGADDHPAPRRVRLPTYPFARERHWFPARQTGPAAPGDQSSAHPLLPRETARPVRRFAAVFTGDEPFLDAHRVGGERVLPAAAHLELVRAAVAKAAGAEGGGVRLRDTVWPRPLVVGADPVDVRVELAPADGEVSTFTVRTGGSRGDDADAVVHSRGSAEVIRFAGTERVDLDAVRRACPREEPVEAVYRRFDTEGLAYGAAMSGLAEVHHGSGELLARIAQPVGPERTAGLVLPPAVLDAAFQASLVLRAGQAGVPAAGPTLPFALELIEVHRPCAAEMWAWVRHREENGMAATFDIDLCDGHGVVSARLRGLVQRTPRTESGAPGRTVVTAGTDWVSAPRAADSAAAPVVHAYLAGRAGGAAAQVAGETGFGVGTLPVVAASRVADDAGEVLVSLFRDVQRVVASRPDRPHRFLVLVDARVPAHHHAALTGLLRTAGLEQPLVSGRLVRVAGLDGADAGRVAEILRAEAAGLADDAEVRYAADGERAVRRVGVTVPGDGPAVPALRDGGVYWVTGGLGGLGRHVARYLARPGGTTIVLSGRSAAGQETTAALAALRDAGVDAHYLPADITVREEAERAVAAIMRDHGALHGVVHAAGVLRDDYVLRKDPAELRAVLAPKVHGTVHLDAVTRDLELDFFALFSSVAGVYGNSGQSDYAAANAFLDAFARHRRTLTEAGERSGHTVAVSWPVWEDGGMTVDDVTLAAMRRRHGWEPLPTEAGLRVLGRALAPDAPEHLVVAFGVDARLQQGPAVPGPAAPDAVGGRAAPAPAPSAGTAGDVCATDPVATGSAAPDDLRGRATALLREMLAEVLRHRPEAIDPSANLVDYGIDSLSILDMTSRLEELFGPLPKTIFFEYLTIDEVAGYFLGHHPDRLAAALAADESGADGVEGTGEPAPTPPSRTAGAVPAVSGGTGPVTVTVTAEPTRRSGSASSPAPEHPGRDATPDDGHDIAIIGMSGSYPGAETLDDFWTLLADGRHSFEEVPRERWDHDAIYGSDRAQPGKSVIRTGTFLRGIDRFDPRYFRISQRDAEQMSPEVRLFLRAGVEALEDAGYSRETIQRRYQGDVGVLVGTMSNHYGLYGFENSLVRGRPQSGSYNGTLPNMLSYFYGLTGPSIFLDTMCSTSSTCVHQAVQMLRAGDCPMVIAGGVNLLLHPYNLITSSQEHFTTATSDVIRSYGLGVDGTILGEGVGAVVLKRLADAERDGDHIHAVIKGTAVTNAGVRNGFSVPSPHAQSRAVTKAIGDAGIDPRTISYVEGHGSGTSLGDPIEVKALTDAFHAHTEDTGFCALGSVKSNMGHLLAAAGVVGIAKVVLQMRHGLIAPSLHSEQLNQDIPFAATPFRVPRELTDWERPVTVVDGRRVRHPRRAGITSIGAGGMNSHLILEEYLPEPDALATGDRELREELFVFSAMTDEALAACLTRFRGFLERTDEAELASVAHTLRVGKNELPRRWAFLARGRAAALAAIDARLAGDHDLAGALAGDGPGTDAARRIATAWVGGRAVDWSEADDGRRLRRTPLPSYPFAQVRCWVESEPDAPSVTAPLAFRERLHPFLGRNESDLAGLRFGLDLRLDDLLDYGYRQDTARRITPLFAVDAALAVARVCGLGSRPWLRDVWLPGPVAWDATARLVTTFAGAGTTGDGTLWAEDAAGRRTAVARFTALSGADGGALPDEKLPHGEAAGVLSGAEFLAELAEGGHDHPAAFSGVRSARRLRDGRLELELGAPEFQQDHVRRNVRVEPSVLAAVAQGVQLTARHAGLPGWARLAPHRIGAARVAGDPDRVSRVVLDLRAGTQGLGGRVVLADADGVIVGELTDVWWGDEEAPRGGPGTAHVESSVAWRVANGATDTASTSLERSGTPTVPVAAASAGRARSGAVTARWEDAEGQRPPGAAPGGPPRRAAAQDPDGGRADGEDLVGFVVGELAAIAAGILKFGVADLEPETGFYAFGFDSMSLVSFAGLIHERLGTEVSPAVFFDRDTLDALARHLVAEHGDRIREAHTRRGPDDAYPEAPATQRSTARPTSERAAPKPPVLAAPVPARDDSVGGEPAAVAIVGAAGRFPGAADLDAWWRQLLAGRDAVSAFPAERYGESYRKAVEAADFPHRAGTLEDVDAFDAAFFGIYPREAELMDPQHRLALETVWHALEDSGQRPSALPSNAGVFLGVSGTDYATLLTAHGVGPDAFTSTGNSHAVLANRISYLLDVRGPSEPVDTACSSSLVAVHRAVEAVRSGTCDVAVAGGVNLLLSVDTFVSADRAGMLSPDGRCRTFSRDANGYVRGEGVGVVVLKALAAAERDGDAVLAVVRGSAVNHGGRAHSLTAPNADAQAEVVAAAIGTTDPDSIGYIEAHGTGTALGDPVEVRALRSAFRRLGATGTGTCGLGSVKTNIGHLEAAAGIAGLLKVVLAMRHGTLPATLHAEELNPYLELDDGPFRVVRAGEPWPRLENPGGGVLPRRAGVSSFGFGGVNCHVVVEEYVPPREARAGHDEESAAEVVVPLSARTGDRLRDTAGALLAAVRDAAADVSLESVAWTLQTGREAWEERVGWVVGSRDELVSALRAFTQDGEVGDGVRGSVRRPGGVTGDGPGVTPPGGHPRDVLVRWARGVEPDWRSLYGSRQPRRAHLPGYPFARERYWIPGHPPRGAEAPEATRAPTGTGGHTTTLLVPRWIPRPVPASGTERRAPARRIVVLHGDLAFARETQESLARIPGLRCVVVAPEGRRNDSRFGHLAQRVFEVVREAAVDGAREVTLVQVVVPADGPEPLGLALAGLTRTAALELPRFDGQLVALSAGFAASRVATLLEAEARCADDVVLHRDGQRLVRSWTVREPSADGPLPWRTGGVYLVTGGAGGAGSAVAGRIARDVRRPVVVLAGRSPLDERIGRLLDGLRAAGATAEYRQADVSRWQEARHLVAGIRAEFGRLDGVVHAAGVVRDAALSRKTTEQWDEVLAPKAGGLTQLDRAVGDAPLDFLIAFSSGAAVTGNPGQADYATANAFVDAFAALRNAQVAAGERSGRTLAVAWPLWADGGMALSDAALAYLWEQRGLAPMPSRDALAALVDAWRLGEDRVWVHHGDATRITDRPERITAPDSDGRLAGTAPSPREAAGAPVAGAQVAVASVTNASPTVSPGDLRAALRQLVDAFARVTRLPAEAVDADRPLEAMGLESIMVMQLNQELSLTWPDLSATLFYDFPTLRAIAEHLTTSTGADRPAGASWPGAAAPPPAGTVPLPAGPVAAGAGRPANEPVAVIGMSGRYPGSSNVAEFWENLRAGRDSVTEIPADRWPLEGFFTPDRAEAAATGRSYGKWGAFVDDFAGFDPLFFRIAPRDAYAMDPQERLFLQAAWEVMEDAGYTRERLARRHGRRVGVFAGVTKSGHARHGAARLPSGEPVVPALSFASLSARTSYVLDVTGPSMTIDTMCSASLTAIHEACEHLRSGSCEMALAGGVNLYTHPLDYVELSHAGMLSRDGKTRSFGTGGAGFVPGEGAGCVLLKPLSRALADGDRVLAVIRGSGVNHGGRSNGYTVPRSGAQAELIREALDRAGVSAREIGYVEAHGTGTELGDPVEIQGLTTAFSADTDELGFCAIGSVKPSIGHLEAAAGVAGLTKAVLQLRHRELVPSLHAEQLNPAIPFDRSPFRVQRELATWDSDGPRIAAVSSFGAGGSNAHVIVEEFTIQDQDQDQAIEGADQVVVVSARTSGQLTRAVERLAAFAEREDVGLAALAHTLRTGREALPERLAFVVSSLPELRRVLRSCLDSGEPAPGIHRGTAGGALASLADDAETRALLAGSWLRSGRLDRLAAAWADGLDVDWDALDDGPRPRPISLPTYPFARDRYWIGDLTPITAAADVPRDPFRSGSDAVSGDSRGTAAADATVAGATFLTAAAADVSGAPAEPVRGTGRSPADPSAAPAPFDREAYVAGVVRDRLARALAMDEAEIAGGSAFADYGLDSILAVRLAHELGTALSLELNTGVLFDHPSADRLTTHLITAYGDTITPPAESGPAGERPAPRGTSEPEPVREEPRERPLPVRGVPGGREPIAVVGMSGRFAGSASPEELWAHLEAGDDLVGTATRWDEPGGTPLRGSFLDGIDEFDAFFFNISGVEAAGMDPQQRLLLEEAWKALEDAGYADRAMDDRRCGVYVGCWSGDYPGAGAPDAPAQGLWGNMASVIPGRVSYVLNLKGPAIAVDTACSSSLAAIDLACKDLWAGETEMALAGGVFVQSTPRLYELAGRAGMLSPTGHCHTFDHRADGFVPGEGVGVLVLKQLSDALADGDHVHGVIRGSGVNHDGATNGLTAPSSLSQRRLLREVYERAGVDTARIGLVEAHGTGTRLGDPIEFEALTQAFGAGTDVSGHCALGSVKTNLGHTQYAAGVAGALKVLLALRHRRIPASLHFEAAGTGITFEGSPFYPSTRAHDWPTRADVPRVGVVSAFGASGTNAHLVLEEAPKDRRERGARPPAFLVVLSARSPEQLALQIERLAQRFRDEPSLDVGDAAYTLLTGRRGCEHRFACVVADRAELLRVLEAGTGGPDAVSGEASARTGGATGAAEVAGALRRYAEAVAVGDESALRPALGALAELFVRGVAFDHAALFSAGRYLRVPLPTYPFARDRHWSGPALRHPGAPTAAPDAPDAPKAVAGVRVPMKLTGEEPFLRDHTVQGQRVLPGVVCLELARKTAAQVLGGGPAAPLRMRNVTWVRPLAVRDAPVGVDLVVRPVGDGEVSFAFVPSGGEGPVYCEGRVALSGAAVPEPADVAALRAACPVVLPGARVHEALVTLGLVHGPSLRAVEEVRVGPDAVVARLRVPEVSSGGPFTLHPALLDSAVQASIAPHLADGRTPEGTAVPFALDRLEIFGPCTETMWAVLRGADGTGPLDIDLVDEAGGVRVRMTGYTARRKAVPVPSLYAPVWDVLPAVPTGASVPGVEDRVLVVGGTTRQWEQLGAAYPRAVRWRSAPDAPAEDVASALRETGPVDHLLWIAPDSAPRAGDRAGLAAASESGVVAAFRMVRALLAAGHDRRPLGITLVTERALATRDGEPTRPVHAGLHGLFGSLGREYPHWTVRRADLEDTGLPFGDLFALPARSGADSWAHRGGQWLRRRWAPAYPAPAASTAYREGGVYVVIGGAGGLGLAWTRYVVERYRAQVVWIGRRPLDAAVAAALETAGGGVRYVTADAADPVSLRRAYEEIKPIHPRIDGVVQAALVLRDRTVAAMDEEDLRAALSAKVAASVAVAEVFGGEPLDFALFFSSVQSFATAAGQSNYAAGSVFCDAYAHLLATEWNCPVRVVNWGWWGTHGSVTSGFYRERMTRAGLVSIEPPEAMAALECLLAGPQEQLAFVKLASPDALDGIDPDTRVVTGERAGQRVPARVLAADAVPGDGERLRKAAEWRHAERDPLLARLLRAHLDTLGVSRTAGGIVATGIHERYAAWLEHALRVAPDAAPPLAAVAAEWDECRRRWSADQDRAAELALVDATLKRLPEILTGAVRPTDVLFPQGSFALVEGCYRDNHVADTYNRAVADTVTRIVAERLRQDPRARVRILEIGAGTGGTSTGLFAALRPYADRIATYTYTDLSKAFLNNARTVFGPQVPYLECARFDVEQPPAGQDIKTGGYDIVVAANVLHATRDIRTTLRNAKAVLRDGGWLVMNELSAFDVFSHLTFGLLEGWWLFEDAPLRIPGSPALSPEGWREVLAAEGFRTVVPVLPGAEALGQQIIAAESDGVVRQPASGPAPRPGLPPVPPARPTVAKEPRSPARGAATSAPTSPGRSTAPGAVPGSPGAGDDPASLVARLRDHAAEVLGVPAERIDPARPLTDYGLDSLLVLQLTHRLREEFDDGIPSTLVFDAETLDNLAARLLPERDGAGSARCALSRSQLGLWQAVRQLPPGNPTYNIPMLFEIHGELDEAALEAACREQAARHPLLGAVFREEGGEPFMELAPERGPSFERTTVTAASREEQLARLRELASVPFDLAAGPLVRVHLVSLPADAGPDRRLLLVTVHHIVVDGTSAAVLLRSLTDSYRDAVRPGSPPERGGGRASFAEFVAWESQLLDSPEGAAHRAYWVRQLRGASGALDLPRDRPAVSGRPPRPGYATARLTPELSAAFTARARVRRSSTGALFLASYAAFLHRVTGQRDLVVGVPTAARYEERFRDVVGQIVNCLPVRCVVEADEEVAELTRRVQRCLTEGVEHGAYPFLEMKRALAELGEDTSSLVVTNLIFQNFEGAGLFTGGGSTAPGELDLRPFDDLPDPGERLLTAEIYQEPDRFKIFFKYDAHAFDAVTAQALLDEWVALIERMAYEPGMRVGGDGPLIAGSHEPTGGPR